MNRLFACLALAMPLWIVSFATLATTIEVLGKHQRSDGSIHDFKVQDGDALSPGDRFQIAIEASRSLYYSIIYVSRGGQASQLFPVSGRSGAIRSGAKLYLPTKDNFFSLDASGGRELMFIVTSPSPLSNIRSALKGVQDVGPSSQSIHQYLDKRLPNVAKLEITNTGGTVSGMADQVSSGLVRDLSARYEADPWSASDTADIDRRKRTRQAEDSSIPEEVRRRAREVRSLLKRPKGTPDSSSLRTTVAQAPAPTPQNSTGTIRREPSMVTQTRIVPTAEEKAAAERKARAEAARITEENQRLQEERLAAARAAEEIKRLEAERESARLAAEERQRQEAAAEAARIAVENKRLEEERLVASLAEEEAERLEQERIAAEKAAAEAKELEQKRIEMARAEEAARKMEEERLAAARAEEEIKRLEAEREAARLAAEERRRQEAEAEAARIAEENQRLEQERIAAEKAEAEVKRLEAEKEARLQAEAKQKEQQEVLAAAEQASPPEEPQPEKKGFLASIFGGGGSDSTDSEEAAEKEYDGTVVATDEALHSPESAAAAEPRAPAEAVVVLQAPVKPQPPKMSAPAPVRVEKAEVSTALMGDVGQLYNQVASSIVAVSTTNDPQASGFILDNKGHVLTSWHVINGVNNIDVQFMAIAGAQRSYKAQVVRHDKFRDLALLKLVNPPEGIQPIVLASGGLPDAGTTVRVFGQKQGEVWATNDAVVTRIAPNFTWFSTNNVIHRGEILQVDLPTRGKGIGALVTSMDYKMLGIKSFSGKETGRTYAVSVNNILDFLQPTTK